MSLPELSMTIGGSKELQEQFAQLSDKAKRAVLRAALRKSANIVVKRVKQTAPRRALRRLPKGTATSIKVGNGRMEADIGFKKAVAWFVPLGLGRSDMPARPFLRPALDDSRAEIVNAFRQTVDEQITRQHGKAMAAIADALDGGD